ncbi:type II toxin-antitoxin system RelE/ParE family toxin [Aquiflexum gelatinilyticum]|uniref:type II toxin-antitoxin system RelE/ParE family toxin n=1 Tax=Aquiflexum gelatinilyticum TaxID=2961943 RepID=UPI002168A8FA|nr:type II toxin-antitoxin system RelE/ParE family toxin [Aquiflexum gelatinilyticum]MCS4436811.1 type II toxin-antitoxin system RelE/ParE family toxin [Aquiflexum gelatinilyticum]
MVKEIVWTRKSIEDRYKIYLYWAKRNKSEVFSKKLELLFNQTAMLVSQFPNIGLVTDFPDVRVKIIKDFKMFYLNHPDKIVILRVWDTRQNPKKLKM